MDKITVDTETHTSKIGFFYKKKLSLHQETNVVLNIENLPSFCPKIPPSFAPT
jgi:hypothetical protein